jgi:hypothetical protein
VAALTPAIERDIHELIRRLGARMRVDAVIVFGSRARGDALRESDVDIAVVAPDFAVMPPLKRLELLASEWPGTCGADIIGFTPEEFRSRRDQLTLVAEIAREGRLVAGAWP